MDELVARLEAASAGSRELDVAMWEASGGWPGVHRPPAVTTSLDAALALAERVLPGWHVMIATCGGPIGSGDHCSWRVTMKGDTDFVTGRHTRAFCTFPHPTPALALCIAVLKATAANSVGTKAEGRSEPPETGTAGREG